MRQDRFQQVQRCPEWVPCSCTCSRPSPVRTRLACFSSSPPSVASPKLPIGEDQKEPQGWHCSLAPDCPLFQKEHFPLGFPLLGSILGGQ